MMTTKKITLIFLFLLASQMLFVSFASIPVTMTDDNNTVNLVEDQNYIADVNLDRVNLLSEAFENGDAEDWTTPRDPADLSTYRSTDRMSWYEQAIENEGARALGMRARGADINHPATAQIFLQSWNNLEAYNLTISLDWRIGQIGFPGLGDRMELYLPFDSGLNIRYCFGSGISVTNTSSNVYYLIDDSPGTWHKLERNVTQDYIEAFGVEPDEMTKFSFFAHSYGPQYTYGYFDDFYLVRNGTVIVGGGVNHGNFEAAGTGTIWYNFNSVGGFGDISTSSDRIEGDSSFNTTVISTSNGHTATTIVTEGIYRVLSDDARDNFTFSWKVSDIQLAGHETFSCIKAYIENATSSYSVYYVTAVGGSTIPDLRSNTRDIQINLGNVNATGDWATLNTSIYEDVQSVREDKNIHITTMQIYTTSSDNNGKLTVLYDNISFNSVTFSDRGYEHLETLGTNVPGWYGGYSGVDGFTVTDFSYSGGRAGNLTVSDDFEEWVDLEYDEDEIKINSESEMILDITWYSEYNQTSKDFLILYLDVGDYDLYYLIMNTSTISDEFIDSEENTIIILPETNTEGEWVNWKIDIAHDYEQVVGEFPNTSLERIVLWGYANVSSTYTVFIDDFYLYEDSAPEITDISQTPTSPEAGENVEISVTVEDATALDVTLHHRVETDDWTNTTMIKVSDNVFEVNITNTPWDAEVEYFVSAMDAFSKTDEIMDGASYFTFTAVDTIVPVISLLPANGSTVSDIASVEWNLTDDGSGVAWSQLFIEGAEVTNTTLDTVGVSWDTNVIPNGDYNITVVVSDNAGHTASVTHLVTVENTGAPQGNLTGVILIVVIIAAVGAIAIIYIFVLKKR